MFNRTNTKDSGVPEAREALDRMKMEIASELGINLKQIQTGDMPSCVAGHMVKRMIEQQEKEIGSKGK